MNLRKNRKLVLRQKHKKNRVNSKKTIKNKTKRKKKALGWLPIRTKRIVYALFALFGVVIVMLLVHPVYKYFFPLKYGVEVQAAAKEYELDPWFVYAVIKTESDFVPDVVSRSGAQGLMQIMPDTADWIAWRQGREHDEEKIFVPSYNIDMGCYLLSYLMEYYNGNIEFVAAAYNAGNGAVDSWLSNPEYYDGETLSIPYNETKNYVAKVKYAYEKYKNLYD